MENTSFFTIYCRFLDKIQDEMLMELSMEDTVSTIESIFFDAIPGFQYPKFNINRFDTEARHPIVKGAFLTKLTNEEEDIIAELMLHEWYRRQLASTRLTQMRYSTSDFKQTSQAAHMQRLDSLIKEHGKTLYKKQSLYSRRKIDEDGMYYANYDALSGVGPREYKKIWTRLGEVK